VGGRFAEDPDRVAVADERSGFVEHLEPHVPVAGRVDDVMVAIGAQAIGREPERSGGRRRWPRSRVIDGVSRMTSAPPSGIFVAVISTRTWESEVTSTPPIAWAPPTARPRAPGQAAGSTHQARPACKAAVRSSIAVDAAHVGQAVAVLLGQSRAS
jgi:hypothetical protein